MRQLIVVGLVALCAMLSVVAVRAEDSPKAPEKYPYPDVSIKELKSAIAEKKVVVIDANGTDSYKDGHIPGAIDFEANAKDLAKVLPKDKDALIVAYCGGPQCMAYQAAAKKAVAMGYTNVKHLSAGISGWKGAGEKVEKADAKAS
jgi:rhodanese-related sulfurtransferase